MKRMLLLPAILLALALAGCAGGGKSVLQGGTSLTASIANPIRNADQATLELTYQTLATPVANYMELRTCAVGEGASLLNPCGDKGIKLTLLRGNRKAFSALTKLRQFRAENPTVSAISLLESARKAVSDYSNAAFLAGIRT